MNSYKTNKKQNNSQSLNKLSVQYLSVQVSDDRMGYRSPGELKTLIKTVASRKGKSTAELHILLWLDYLSKANYIEGKIQNKSAQELKEDVEYFLKNA